MTTLKDQNITESRLEVEMQKAFEDLGYEEKFALVDDVSFNSRLRSSGARCWVHKGNAKNPRWKVDFNPALKYEELEDTAKHEAIHIITNERDSSEIFKQTCNKYDVPLNCGKLESVRDYKYQIVCNECGKKFKKYKKKGKYIKHIENGNTRLSCTECNSRDLKVIYFDKKN